MPRPRSKSDPAVVCAWCKKIVKRGTYPASHTICRDCYFEQHGVYPEDEEDYQGERKRNFYGYKGVPRGTFIEWMSGTIVVTGEVHIRSRSDEKVTIAICHDGTGFQPAAAIYAEQGVTRDQAVEAAQELLRRWFTEKQPLYLSERFIEEEEEEEQHWDCRSWVMDKKVVARIIKRNKRALKYVDIAIP